jgi:hypothetical protein
MLDLEKLKTMIDNDENNVKDVILKNLISETSCVFGFV